jgi:OmpA-OmpF porin, OOP family
MSNFKILGLFIVFTSLFAPSKSHAQYEFGAFIGGSNYQGDLADGVIQLKETHLALGGFMRYSFSPKMALRMSVYRGQISGSDGNSALASINSRGYSFSSPVTEISFCAEYYPFGKSYASGVGINGFKLSFQPYITAGFGLTSVSAVAKAPISVIPYPFPEPGSRDNFLSVPLGIGTKMQFSENMAIGLELGWRTVFSDFLDGVSIHGSPQNDDWYVFGGLTFSYILPANR